MRQGKTREQKSSTADSLICRRHTCRLRWLRIARGKWWARFALLAALVPLLAIQAWPDVLYTNGPPSFSMGAEGIDAVLETTNSFVISSRSVVTGVSDIGFWQFEVPSFSLDWVISTLPDGNGTIEGQQTSASLSNITRIGANVFVFLTAGFSVSNLTLTPGTYYLELFNNTGLDWDVNNGPSTADEAILGIAGSSIPVESESFEVDGRAAPAPEPSSMALLTEGGIAMLLFGGLKRFLTHQPAAPRHRTSAIGSSDPIATYFRHF